MSIISEEVTMFKRLFIFLLVAFFSASLVAQPQENELSLSLEDCVVKAMQNNLGVAIEVLSPELAGIAISRANEKFMPSLSLNYDRNDTSSASYSFLDAAGTVSQLQSAYSAQVIQQIPTGGNFSVMLDGYGVESNRNFQTINPRYGSTLRFNFTQPLLKDFGLKISRKEIIVAKNNYERSEKDLQKALQDTVYSVEDAYWNLIYAIENLKVKQQSLSLAQDLLEKNRRAVEVGTMAPIDILTAQAQVASREADILQADAQVKNQEDMLKTIINLGAENQEADLMKIVPTDKPFEEKKEVSLDQALSIAMQSRPDLQASRVTLKNNEIELSYTKNQLLPDLSLNASYWSPGVSGDQIIYQGGNPLTGPAIDTIPGGYSDSLKDAFGFKFQNWSIGLTLNVPLNSFLSRAAFAQARVNLEQSQLRLRQLEQQVFTDLKIAVRDVETNYKRIQALKLARELAERQLEAEEEKLKVGLSTNYFVLQYQTELSNQRSLELRAIIDYNLSLAGLSRELGVSLQEKNIKMSDMKGR